MTTRTAARAARLDQVCADAVGVARGAITEVDPSDIGDHLEAVAEGDRLVTHFFECHLAGYKGWRWAVTVTRVPRSRHVTICETVLLPGPDAMLAPGWLPWNERLQPGDLGVGDLMPTAPDDDRLAPGYVLSDDPAVEEVSWELGLGRSRVMSREGRIETAQRWYDGDSRPGGADLHRRAAQRPLRHLRLLPAAGRFDAADVRGLRQPLRPGRRPGGQRRPRLRRALRGAAGRRRGAGRGAADGVRRQRGRGGRGQPGPGSVEAGEPAEAYGHS